eukprot:CAMPEP_0119192474 /NCGR_PEP_ID=MMETSP1316-20130426/2962_1 /TAXON_ID=41880 /ORGANISM="Pycnococcus provasolii, Strain RCC2336" /LENGTH=197 /DNA_ID=CAMNT_0007187647 /DNA_START=1 /DNA_END=594 /DNA_ORIENTATION=-
MSLSSSTSARPVAQPRPPSAPRAPLGRCPPRAPPAFARVFTPVVGACGAANSWVCSASTEASASTSSAEAGAVNDAPIADYAIIEVGGSQKIVSEGRFYTTNNLKLEPGTEVKFERVLAARNGDDFYFGQPYLEKATVHATILSEERGPKVITFKMLPKKHYRKKTGSRAKLTKFLVTKIEFPTGAGRTLFDLFDEE